MKSSIQTKTLVLSFVASFLLNACGSGGSGGRPFPNQNVDADPDSVTWINPSQGQSNVCRRSTFTVSVGDSRACNWNDVSSAFTLFSMNTGPDVPVDTTMAAPMLVDPADVSKGCKFIFKPKKALIPNHNYGMSFRDTPFGSVGIQRDSVTFTTGDILGSSCAQSEQFYPYAVVGIPRELRSTNVDQFGSVDAAGNFVFDWTSFGQTFGTSILSGLFGGFLGIGNVPTNTSIIVQFNDSVDSLTVASSIRIYELQSGWVPGMPLLNPIPGVQAQVQGNQVILSAGGSGFVPNTNYLLVVARSLRSNAEVYMNGSYFSPFTTGN